MQRVLSSDLWKTVKDYSRKAKTRQVAIAYVTKDLLGLRSGDTLVVNASRNSIATGQTSAKLLRELDLKRVALWNCETLHAKALVLGRVAVIGSGNMSGSSVTSLIEAALITDHGATVSGAASLIQQLIEKSVRLDAEQVAALCKIKVVRRGWAPFHGKRPSVQPMGNRTWLVGVREVTNDPTGNEARLIGRASKALREKTGHSEFDWLRWAGSSRFTRECRAGDTLIRIWRSHKGKKPNAVLQGTSVLLRQRAQGWTRFYLRESAAEMTWGRFKKLLRDLGYPKKISFSGSRQLDADLADAIDRSWESVAK